MNVPEAFKYLATCFHSRSALEHATAEEWVGSTVRDYLSMEQRKAVKQFLDELLDSPSSDDDLQRIWENLDSDYWFESGSGVRVFFTMIRNASE